MASELPPFAQQWVQQWKQAAPRLQAIRDEELRRLGGQSSQSIVEHCVFEKYPHRHGMVIMQQWFMRRHLLDCENQQSQQDG